MNEAHYFPFGADAAYFLAYHWLGTAGSYQRRCYLQTLLDAAQQQIPAALDSLTALLRPGIAGRVMNASPGNVPFKLVLQQTEHRLRSGLLQIEGVDAIEVLCEIAVQKAVADVKIKLQQFDPMDQPGRLERLNSAFWKLDVQLQTFLPEGGKNPATGTAPNNTARAALAGFREQLGVSYHLRLDYYAPPAMGNPVYTHHLNVSAEGLTIGEDAVSHRFGNKRNWKPWSQLADLSQPYHYLLYLLLVRSDLLLERITEIEYFSVRLQQCQDWTSEVVI